MGGNMRPNGKQKLQEPSNLKGENQYLEGILLKSNISC